MSENKTDYEESYGNDPEYKITPEMRRIFESMKKDGILDDVLKEYRGRKAASSAEKDG